MATLVRADLKRRDIDVEIDFSIDKGVEDYDYGDYDYDNDDCDFGAFDGTCDNFHPTQDCFFTQAAHIEEKKCEAKAKSNCASTLQGDITGECMDTCVDFHLECCCPALTQEPTLSPTFAPTTFSPTSRPTPTRKPTLAPTDSPTNSPTFAPTVAPTVSKAPVTPGPTREPWAYPTKMPTDMPVVPTASPTSKCYNPETESPYYFSLIGQTETCTDFFHGFPKTVSCLFDSEFARTERCMFLPVVRCKQEMAKYPYNYENDECLQECIKFHTLCCCGDEVN